jgi:arsenate reductase-like glutaredoxin family protein
LKDKIKKSQQELSKWSKKNSGHTEELINLKTKQLKELQGGEGLLDMEKIKKLQREVNEVKELDELKWQQRAKEN